MNKGRVEKWHEQVGREVRAAMGCAGFRVADFNSRDRKPKSASAKWRFWVDPKSTTAPRNPERQVAPRDQQTKTIFQHVHKGFTLVEIILSISLVAILFALSAIILDRGVDSFADISKRGAKNQEARMAMERMARELITVKAGPSGKLTSLQTDRVQFTDSLSLAAEFRLNGTTLYRNSDPLLQNVTALTFTGYKSDGSVTSAAPQVRRIRMELSTLAQGQTAPLILRTEVFLRTDLYENFQ